MASDSLEALRADMLEAALADGSYLDMPTDVAAEFANAVRDAPGYTPLEQDMMHEELVAAHTAATAVRLANEVSDLYQARDMEIHEPARAGIIKCTGVTPEQYDAAVQASRTGNPSALLSLQTSYLDAIF